MAASGVQYEIDVERLTYNHTHSAPPSLSNVFIKLPKGSRTILVGANGGELGFLLFQRAHSATYRSLAAGKSTLLQILAGKRLILSEGTHVNIKGRDVFRNSPPGVTFLGTEW